MIKNEPGSTIQIYLFDSTRTGLSVEVVARWTDRTGYEEIELLRSEMGTHVGSVASDISADVAVRLRREHPSAVVQRFDSKCDADRSWSLRYLGYDDGVPRRQ